MATKKPAPFMVKPAEPVDFDRLMSYVPEGVAQQADTAPQPSGVMRRLLGDGGIALLKGAIAVPEAAVGLADLASGGRVGRFLENEGGTVGFRPEQARQVLDEMLTPEQQAANRAVQEAEGFTGKLGAAVANPSTIATTVTESLPLMLGGAGVARGLVSLAPRMGAVAAGAAGEGVVAAGSAAEQVRQNTEDGLLTAKQAGLAAVSGATTGALSLLGGKVAQRLGIGDVDTLLAQATIGRGVQRVAAQETAKGFVRKVLEGAVSEGVLEELPQSVAEQVLQNAALDKPLDEGVDYAAVMGLLSGAVMGGAVAPLARPGDQLRQDKLPEVGPMTRAVNAAVESAAQKVDAGAPIPADPAQAAAPAVVPVAGQPAQPAPAATAPGVGFTEAFDSLKGGGVSADLVQQMFSALQAGTDVVAGVRDPILARARPAFDAGQIQSPADLAAWIQQNEAPRPAAPGRAEPRPAAPAAAAPLQPASPPEAGFTPEAAFTPVAPAAADPLAQLPAEAAAPAAPPVATKRPRPAKPPEPPEPVEEAQEGDIKATNGKPFTFAMREVAMRRLAQAGQDTHELVRVRGGLVIRRKPGAEAPPAEAPAPAAAPAAPPAQATIDAVPPAPRTVTIGGEQVALDEKQAAEWDRVGAEFKTKFDAAKAEYERTKDFAPTDNPDMGLRSAKERLDAESKRLGMELAAERRRIAGKLTAKERAAADTEAARIRVGDTVQTPEGTGKVTGNAYGKVRVQVGDRTVTVPHKQATKVEPQAAAPAAAPVLTAAPSEQGTPVVEQVGPAAAPSAVSDGGGLLPSAQRPTASTEKLADRAGANTVDPGDIGATAASQVDGVSGISIDNAGIPGAAQRDSAALEGALDVRPSNAKLRSDILKAHPRLVEGLGALEVPSQRAVLALVSSGVRDLKVLKTVVSLVPVDVMNDLIGAKTTTKSLLDNPSMLSDALSTIDPSSDVAARFVASVVGVAARSGAEVALPKVANAESGNAAAKTSKSKHAGNYGASNTVFTADAAQKARDLLRRKLGTLNSGIDPEILQAGITLAGHHIEAGARTFAAYARAMVEDLGEGVKPYLQSWYMAVRADPRAAGFKADMDKASAVEDLTVEDINALLADQPTQTENYERQVTRDDDGGVIVSYKKGDARVTVTIRPDRNDVLSADLEKLGGSDIGQGTGIATRAYVDAFEVLANDRRRLFAGFASETVQSDRAVAIYKRLIAAGMPFERGGIDGYPDSAYTLTQQALKDADYNAVRRKLAENAAKPKTAIAPAATPTLQPAPAPAAPPVAAPAQNATKENQTDERTSVPSQGPQALDPVAAEEGGGTEGDGGDGAGPADGGQAGPRPSGGADAAGLPAARSGGGGAGRVRAAGPRARGDKPAVGAGGTRRPGARVPADDARAVDPAVTAASNIPAQNFQITADLKLGEGGEVAKFNDNVAAIKVLKALEAENRRATPDEQRTLARYVGWGGLAAAFPDPISGQFKPEWKARGEALRDLLTEQEYAAARRSTRNAHYTSEVVASSMWDMARRLGYRGGLVLESSMGSGNFLGLKPADLPANFIGIEYDSLTARLAAALYPQAAVLHAGFQQVPLADNAFALNIGNPPFGSESLRFQFKPELGGVSIHNQFFRAGLDAVRPGGLQIMVVSRFLMDAQDTASRAALARDADLVAAIRLPDSAFKTNARTEVVTDIIILRKLQPAEAEQRAKVMDEFAKPTSAKGRDAALAGQAPTWVQTTQVPDPLGGEAMTVNRYFAANPKQILGVLERSGSMQHGADITVRLDNPAELGRLLAERTAALPEGISNIDADVMAATEQRFKLLADSLRIAVAQQEPGHLDVSPDGALQRVIEREAPDGGFFFAKQDLTPESPWSDQLSMDGEGRWYKLEAATDADGKPVKVLGKDGKPTKRNLYTRTVYATEADVPASLRLGDVAYRKLRALAGLRNTLKQQLALETEDAPARVMEANRKRLADAYGKFREEFGPINRDANLRLAMTMPDGGLVAALESGYQPARTAERAAKTGQAQQDEQATPAPILSTRVVPKYEPATRAATPADALAISLAERGRVDMERIAALLGKAQDEAAAELQAGDKPLVFFDPEANAWETANGYLSGMVKRKLNAARAAGLTQNVKALEAVMPQPWTAEQVTAQLGATWVPGEVYADFARHLMGGKARVTFSPLTNAFSLTATDGDAGKAAQWSSDGAPAAYILQRMLNSQSVVVTETDADGNTRINQDATRLAGLKAKEIAAEFDDWVFRNGERRAMLVDLFNEKFNTRVVRQYDGQHLILPGKVPDAIISMRRHQKNAIWRGISERFMLVDHVVGAGKTFTAIARAMERRRMGLARKPVIVVPNHLVEQWAADVYRLYPGARVLAAGANDFSAQRRRRLFGRIATGDWDIVIVPHSSFGFIGIAPETEQRFLEAEMAAAKQAIKEAWEQAEEDGTTDGRRKPFGVKEAERLAEKIQARMDRLREGARDKLLTFEQLGIDDLTVDEAHEFKNLFYSSRLTGVRGMGNKTGSRKAADLYNKVRVLRENGGAVTFMTGTPISNSAVEMFTMMRYLAADALSEQGMEHFDAWRAQYVEATPAFEPTESGRLKEVTRLGRTWSNMRSLMDLYYQFTDVVTLDDIKQWYAEDNKGKRFPVPKVKGGDRKLMALKPTPAQEAMLREVLAGFDGLDGIEDPYERNKARLRLMDQARKVSLDVRAVSAANPSTEPGGKLEVVAGEVKRIYDQSATDKGTQLVFLDRSVPKARGDDKILKEYDDLKARQAEALRAGDEDAFQEIADKLDKFDANEMEEVRAAQAGGWNAYQQIKDNLVRLGIPANEIRFVQEAANDEQKKELFDQVNAGKVRVLIGSTPRMGAGTNVQARLVGLHHVDVTWKPSDIEQREGRIIRQGNKLLEKYGPDFEVEIIAYATERTVDAKMWDLNATKLRTINGIRKYDGAFSMEFEDDESVSMAEMAALASGNPLLLERVKLESEISTLELQERAHRRKEFGVQDAIDSAERAIRENPGRIEAMTAETERLQELVAAEDAEAAARRVTVEGAEFTSRMEATRAAEDAIKSQQAGNESARYSVKVGDQRLTNRGAIEEAIGDALGDVQPFSAVIGGEKFTRRNPAGKAIGEQINKALASVQPGAAVELRLGTILGHDLVADVSRRRGGDTATVDLSLLEGERTVTSESINLPDIRVALTTAKLGNALSDLAGGLRDRAATGQRQVGFLRNQLERATRDLPELKAKANQPFPKADELAGKRGRLRKVVQDLSSTAPVAEATPGDQAATPSDIAFSRARGPNRGVPLDDAKAVKAAIRQALPTAPDIHIMETLSQAPRALREKMKADGAEDAEAAYHDGAIYVFPRNIESVERMQFVVGHHEIRHHGIRSILGTGDEMRAAMLAMWQGNQKLRKAAQAKIDAGLANTRVLAVEEALADMPVAEMMKFKGWPRLVAALRQWLRQVAARFRQAGMHSLAALVEPKTWTDADVANFVLRAEGVSRGGTAVFRAGGTVFGRDGAQEAGRRGTYSPADPDIRFSRPGAATARAVVEQFDDLTRTAKSFNWWHRTVGTQYHKARTKKADGSLANPEFAQVYDKAQEYLHDTSAFANDPADMAGDLLPQLRTLADMGKKLALPKADADNLARAVFGGTLTYTRDDSGRVVEAGPDDTAGVVFTPAELREMFGFTDKQVKLYQQFRRATDRSLDILAASDVARLLGDDLPESMKGMLSQGDTGRFKGLVTAMLKQQREAAEQALADVRRRHRNEMAALNRRQKQALAGPGGRAGQRIVTAGQFTDERNALKFKQGGEKHRAEQAVKKAAELDDMVRGKYERIAELQDRGYAPLMRFGRYTVDVLGQDGSRQFFGMFETEREANAAARKFRQAAQADGEETTVTQGLLSEEAYKQFAGLTPETIELFAEVAGVEKTAIFEQYLRLAKNNRSAMKRLIRRTGVAGFSEDTPRVLASFITSNARAAASNLHLGQMKALVEDIPKQMGDVKDEAIKLRDYVQNPREEAQAIRSLLFVQYLGGSVASAMVNLTQPLMMTFPYLSQFGGPAKAAGRLLQAMRLALTGVPKGTPLERALRMADKEGITAPQELHQLQAEASRNLGSNPHLRRFLFAWGSLFSLAEQFNRRVSFIAAFQTAQEQKIAGAFSFAAGSVDETQGVYNKGNRPNWARGAIGATLFTFKQYSVSYVEFLKRLPTRERAMALAILLLAAGAQGLPGADDLDDLIDTLGQHLGYDTNAQLWKARVLNDALGDTAADFVLHGFSALPGIPLDVAGRLGLGNLIPGTGLLLKSKTDKTSEVVEAIGPFGSTVVNTVKAIPALLAGDVPAANEVAGPVALRNLFKALEMYQTGEYRDMRDRKVVDVTAADAAVKAIGFQPSGVARDSRKVQLANQQVALARNVEAEIASQWAQGIVDKEPEKVAAARERLIAWNRANPDSKIAITRQQIARRVKDMRLPRDERFLKTAPREMRGSMAEVVG